MNCVECDHKCYEYLNNGTSDKAYYEWTHKQDKCEAENKTQKSAEKVLKSLTAKS